jgi:PAS domain S-box-containing protein
MNDQDKTKEELIKELQELKQKYNSLQKLYTSTTKDPDKADGALLRKKAEEAMPKIKRSELELTNKKLHESEEKYRTIFETMLDAYYEAGLDGKVIDISPSIEIISKGQYTRDEMIGKALDEVYFDFADKDAFLSELYKYGMVTDYELALKNKDGSAVPVSISSGLIRDKEGNPVKIAGTLRDITDRKLAEKKLRLSEEKYRTIFETMLDAYYEASLDGKVIDISPAIEIISKGQYTRDELIGKPMDEIYYDFADRDSFFTEINKYGKVIDYELALKNKDGSAVPVSISSGLIRDKKGHPVKIAGTMRDITERKQTQEALIKNKIRLQQMAEQSGTVIWEIDRTGMYTYVSPISKQVWDYSPEELVGKKHFYDLHPKEGREEFKLISLQTISKKEIFKEFPNQMLTKSNKLIWVSTNGVPILDHEGNLIGYRGADYDITDRKLAENALNDKNNILTNLIVNMQEGVLLEDADRKIALTNQLFCSMFSIPAPPEVMIGADCTCSAEEIKHFFKNPDKFIADINLILTNKKAVFNDALELVDGRHFQRDYIPTYLENQYSGHLWKYRDITELKNAEASLKKLSQAIEQSPVMTYITGISGMIEYVNPKMLEITGYSEKELLGQNPRIFGSGERPKEEYKELWQTIASGKEWKGEFHNKKKNRELYWVSATISPVIDAGGNITHYLAVEEDITIRKQSEEHIKQQNERLNAIISAMPDMIFVIDKEGTYTEFYYVNSERLPIPKDQIVGANLADFFDKEKGSDYLKHIKNCIQHKKLITFEYSFTEENELKYFEARIAPLGKDKTLSIVRNVTADREKVSEIKKLSLAIEQSPVSIVISNTKGDIEYTNPAFELATGYSLEEVMGKNPRMLKSGKMDEAIYKDLWETISSGKEWHGEWINKKKNGEFYWEDVSIKPVYGENKKITNYLAVKLDITQRKQSEKKIQELNASLEQKVKDRTAQFKEALNRLNKIADRVPGMVYQYRLRPDGTSCFPFASEGIKDIYRVNPQEVADDASPVFANLHPDDLDGVAESIQASASNLEVWQHEYRVKFDDGTIRWLSGNATPQKEADGSILWHGFITDVTQHKQKEEELALEKQRLDSIIQGTNVGTWEWNVKTGKATFNERWADVIGYTLEEISPVSIETWMKFAHPDDLKQSGELLEQHFKGELDYYSFESRMKHKNGEWIWVLDRGKVHEWDTDGKPLLMSGTHQDITTRKQAEAEIEESKERHRGLSEAAFDSIFFSEKGICIQQNSVAEKVFGYTTEEAIGRYGTDWIIPEHRKIVMDNMMAGAEEPYEVTALRKDGTTFPCMLSGKMMNYKGRNVRVTSLNDITELKLAEEELRESEIKHSSMISNISDVIGIIGVDGVMKYKSLNIEKHFGWQPNDLIGTDGLNTVHPDDLERIQNVFFSIKQTDQSAKTVEFRYKCKDGSYKPVELTATNLINDPVIKGVLLNYHDITERKRADKFENELLQLSMLMTATKSEDIPVAINNALTEIGSFLYADRAYIFEISEDGSSMNNSYEWCHDGINPEIENLQDLPVSIFPMWMKSLLNKENIQIPSVKDLPESWSAEREILEPQGVQSLVVIPILNHNQLIGFVGLDSVKSMRKHSESEINNLRVWANMMAGILNKQKAEHILTQTRINYETFFNTINDFLFVLNEQGNIIHTNNIVINRLGYSTRELMNQSVLMVHPPERREEAGRIVGEMLAGTSEFCPVPLVTKSGEYIPVETKVKPGFWDGKPVIFGVTKDVSQIKLSEEKFSRAFQINSALMAISDLDGTFIDVNDTFLKVLGFSREEVIGHTSLELNILENPDFINSITDNLEQNIAARDIELNIRTKSGEIRFGLFSADSIYIGKDKCLLTMMVDITERKLAEAEVLTAKNEAENANRAKSEFLSRMSHELRTPLNSILGFAQLMEMGDLKPSHKKRLNHILNNGKHLLKLINEVLDIAGIESGNQTLFLETVNLNKIINEVIDVVQVTADKKNVTIEMVSSPLESILVEVDKLRLKQVLINLTSNAIKYNREWGKIYIRTKLQPSTTKHISYIRISIIDTGTGIKPEDIKKLFQPFERIGAEKTETEGTGLGLTVVKNLVEAMGGKVGVESKIGEGSIFWIEIPLSDSKKNATVQSKDVKHNEIKEKSTSSTILYIEDNLSNIELVEEILTDHRPSIKLISSIYGEKTIKLAKEHLPKLILLDLDLPDMNGDKVLDILLADPVTRKIPVIIVSADAMPQQIKKLIKLGAVDYLTKPLEVSQFLKIIDSYNEA